MIEPVLAGIVLALCVALLLRMALPERRRQRLDAACARALQRSRQLARRLWFWCTHRRRAAREADDLIRRAQRKRRRADHAVRPDAFKGPRKPH